MIGDAIKAARKARGWTQKDLAEHSGISLGYIKQLEINSRPNPGGSLLRRLADAFDCTVDQLLTESIPVPNSAPPPLDELQAAGLTLARIAEIERNWGEWSPQMRQFILRQLTALREAQHQAETQQTRITELKALLQAGDPDHPGDTQEAKASA